MTRTFVGVCGECKRDIYKYFEEEEEDPEEFIYIEGEGVYHRKCWEDIQKRRLVE